MSKPYTFITHFRTIAPLAEAIGSSPHAFTQAASRNTSAHAASATLCLGRCAGIPYTILLVRHDSSIRPTDVPPDLLRRVLLSTRLVLSLPAVSRNLFASNSRPSTRDNAVSILFVDIVSFTLGYLHMLQRFILCFEDEIRGSLPHYSKLESLFSSSFDTCLVADLLEVSGDILNASVSARLTPTPVILKMYSGSLATAQLFFDARGLSTSDKFRYQLVSSGAWVVPFFNGVEQIVIDYEEGKQEGKRDGSLLVDMANVLTSVNMLSFDSEDPNSQYSLKTAAVLAKPKFQNYAMDVLDRVEKWLSIAPDLEPEIHYGGLMLPLLGYALLGKAAHLHAQTTGADIAWGPIARAITALSELWVKLEAAPPALKSRILFATITLARTFLHLTGAMTYACDRKTLNFTGDVLLAFNCAAERVLMTIATAPQFGNSFDPQFMQHARTAMNLSYTMFAIIEHGHQKVPVTKEVGAATLLFLEILGKTAILLTEVPKELRARFLSNPHLQSNGNDKSKKINERTEDPDKWWFEKLTLTLHSVLPILKFSIVSCATEGEEQAACGVLIWAHYLQRLEQYSSLVPVHAIDALNVLQGQCAGMLGRCVVPSDVAGFLKAQAALEEDDPLTEGSFAKIWRQAGEADPLDPWRMKTRAQVLRHRSCAYLGCTALRPSLAKSFGKLCSGCHTVRYCSLECQRKDWKIEGHKIACKALQNNS